MLTLQPTTAQPKAAVTEVKKGADVTEQITGETKETSGVGDLRVVIERARIERIQDKLVEKVQKEQAEKQIEAEKVQPVNADIREQIAKEGTQ